MKEKKLKRSMSSMTALASDWMGVALFPICFLVPVRRVASPVSAQADVNGILTPRVDALGFRQDIDLQLFAGVLDPGHGFFGCSSFVLVWRYVL